MPAKLEKIKDEGLRAQLEQVHQQLRQSKPTDAVRTVSDVFLSMLREHPDILEATVPIRQGMRVPVVMRWPALGANLLPDSVREKSPKIEFVRDHFAMSEAITYYEFTVDTAIGQGL